jgi:hypothetical protein
VVSSTVRKTRKIKRWRTPLFEKRENSNGGELHCSKNGESQTVASSTVRKMEKVKRWRAPLFEKRRKSNGGELHCSKKGEIQTVG